MGRLVTLRFPEKPELDGRIAIVSEDYDEDEDEPLVPDTARKILVHVESDEEDDDLEVEVKQIYLPAPGVKATDARAFRPASSLRAAEVSDSRRLAKPALLCVVPCDFIFLGLLSCLDFSLSDDTATSCRPQIAREFSSLAERITTDMTGESGPRVHEPKEFKPPTSLTPSGAEALALVKRVCAALLGSPGNQSPEVASAPPRPNRSVNGDKVLYKAVGSQSARRRRQKKLVPRR